MSRKHDPAVNRLAARATTREPLRRADPRARTGVVPGGARVQRRPIRAARRAGKVSLDSPSLDRIIRSHVVREEIQKSQHSAV